MRPRNVSAKSSLIIWFLRAFALAYIALLAADYATVTSSGIAVVSRRRSWQFVHSIGVAQAHHPFCLFSARDSPHARAGRAPFLIQASITYSAEPSLEPSSLPNLGSPTLRLRTHSTSRQIGSGRLSVELKRQYLTSAHSPSFSSGRRAILSTILLVLPKRVNTFPDKTDEITHRHRPYQRHASISLKSGPCSSRSRTR